MYRTNMNSGGLCPTDCDTETVTKTCMTINRSGTFTNKTNMPAMASIRPTNTSVLYCIKYQPTYWITPTNENIGSFR